jgi:hypothetical protein
VGTTQVFGKLVAIYFKLSHKILDEIKFGGFAEALLADERGKGINTEAAPIFFPHLETGSLFEKCG